MGSWKNATGSVGTADRPARRPPPRRDRPGGRPAARRPGVAGAAALRRALLVGALGPDRFAPVPLRGAQPSQRQRLGRDGHASAVRRRPAGRPGARHDHPPLHRRPGRRRPGERREVPPRRLRRLHRHLSAAQQRRPAPVGAAGAAGRPAVRRPLARGRRRPDRRAGRRPDPARARAAAAYLELLVLLDRMRGDRTLVRVDQAAAQGAHEHALPAAAVRGVRGA